jgi:hypothetical protein
MYTAVDEVDALLEEAGKRGFLWHRFRDNLHGPEVLAGVLEWPTCADVVVLGDDRDSHAYRAPLPVGDFFAPLVIHWWYGHDEDVGMVWVLRALLTLPRPDQPGGLPPLRSAPPGTGVLGDRRPVRVSPWRGR